MSEYEVRTRDTATVKKCIEEDEIAPLPLVWHQSWY